MKSDAILKEKHILYMCAQGYLLPQTKVLLCRVIVSHGDICKNTFACNSVIKLKVSVT